MKRRTLAVLGLWTLAGCNLWGSSVPSGFGGWFHHENAGRAFDLAFSDSGLLEIQDLGCDASNTTYQQWTTDGDALVAYQSPGSPEFIADPNVPGALQATPGMFGPDSEQWLPGAICPVCPPGDAGVVACEIPGVVDAGVQ